MKSSPMVRFIPTCRKNIPPNEPCPPAAERDWQIEQTAPDDLPSVSTAIRTAYGFLDLHTGYFAHVTSTENEVNELGAEAENATLARRQELREANEENKWDEEHYL
jgi:protein SHQ1